MRKRKRAGEEDRILRFGVTAGAALLIIGVIVVVVRMMHLRVDPTEGE